MYYFLLLFLLFNYYRNLILFIIRLLSFFLGVNEYTTTRSWKFGLGPSFDQTKTEYAMVTETFNLYG